jgi:hypothetical protein
VIVCESVPGYNITIMGKENIRFVEHHHNNGKLLALQTRTKHL